MNRISAGPLTSWPNLLPDVPLAAILKCKMLKVSRVLPAILVTAFLLLVPAGFAAAASTSDQGIVQSYATDGTVRTGMIVGLKKGDNGTVVSLTSDTVSNMFGVAISANDAPITLSGDAARQVYVATTGQYNVLVSDQNGAIHTGDYISISALNGVGMKAEDTQPTVLGRAANDLKDSNLLAKDVELKTSAGRTIVVNIGVVPVTITVANNPKGGHGTGNLPGFLQVAAGGIADRPVSAGRVYLSLAMLLLAAFIAGSLLYSGVRGSLLSIGRNPLAKKYIIRGLIQTVLTAVIIFILGLFGVYLLLRL